MRRDKVLRFVTAAFAVGAFVGLICGLAFGGGDSSGGTKTAPQSAETTSRNPSDSGDTGTPSDGLMTAQQAEAIGANEMGDVLVLVYYQIGSEAGESTRTPDGFRTDIALLKSEGFYPVNVRDLISGDIDIPAGKSPVVITFDESTTGQYRILDDGTLDPDCAVGILQAAVENGGWAAKASFFCLINVASQDKEIFGQADMQKRKLRELVGWGYEVGSRTVSNVDLSDVSSGVASEELATSQATLEDLIGSGYSVTSLSLPLGHYPASDDILSSGEYEDITYSYTAAVGLESVPSLSPFSSGFQPLHIPRIKGGPDAIQVVIDNFKDHPELRYVSDGDPTTISAPSVLDPSLGEPRNDLGRPVIRY